MWTSLGAGGHPPTKDLPAFSAALFIFWHRWWRRRTAEAAIKKAGFSLAQGILLEKSGSLLRWGCPRSEALATGSPRPRPRAAPLPGQGLVSSSLDWEEIVLDGLPVSLTANLPEGEILTEVLLYDRGPGTPGDHHWRFLDHLVPRIGNPTEAKVSGTDWEETHLCWRREGCRLTLYTTEHYGEFTVLQINRETVDEPAACRPDKTAS